MSYKTFGFLVLLFTVVVSVVFYHWPIDIWVAHYFYTHHAFGNVTLNHVMSFVRIFYRVYIVGVLALIIYALVRKNKTLLKQSVFLFVCLAVGAGLTVTAMKRIYGRPRPVNVTQFGGAHHYQRPWQMGHGCHKNCSFISGEGAMSFQFIAPAFILLAWRRKKWVISLGGLFYCTASILRVTLGRHFLSDVLLAGCIMLLFDWLLYYVMFYRPALICGNRDAQGIA